MAAAVSQVPRPSCEASWGSWHGAALHCGSGKPSHWQPSTCCHLFHCTQFWIILIQHCRHFQQCFCYDFRFVRLLNTQYSQHACHKDAILLRYSLSFFIKARERDLELYSNILHTDKFVAHLKHLDGDQLWTWAEKYFPYLVWQTKPYKNENNKDGFCYDWDRRLPGVRDPSTSTGITTQHKISCKDVHKKTCLRCSDILGDNCRLRTLAGLFLKTIWVKLSFGLFVHFSFSCKPLNIFHFSNAFPASLHWILLYLPHMIPFSFSKVVF